MASFVERSIAPGPLSLPRGWHQFKHNSLIQFFASPKGDALSTRWVAEIEPSDSSVTFWQATTSDEKYDLTQYEPNRSAVRALNVQDWLQALEDAEQSFKRADGSPSSNIDVELEPLPPSATQGWSYDAWLDALTDEQRSFVDAPTDKSIRLRGPGGSGKTLALTMKALREARAAHSAGTEVRILLVTHSWSLATEISTSIDQMSETSSSQVDVFPLLEIAKSLSPNFASTANELQLIGEDSLSGKLAQLDEISEILREFRTGDWVTFRAKASETMAARIDSEDPDEFFALAWDLLIEFGSVIGAAAIFPGAGAGARYHQLARSHWMLPLESRADRQIIFHLYEMYMARLDQRSLWTTDQVHADLLSHLETHSWNRARRTEGYDLIFVDEFHLFNPLERQVLHYLSRDVANYPRIFMAVDPRQSPSEAFIGSASDATHQGAPVADVSSFGDVASIELTEVHRYSPEILNLIKHLHHAFPTLDLGNDWDVDLSRVESTQESGEIPSIRVAESRTGEEDDVVRAAMSAYSQGRVAIAVVDERQWGRYSQVAARVASSGKYHVSVISGRRDIDGLGYRRRGLVVGPAEYMAGLQFETVLVVALPNVQVVTQIGNERTRLLSLLYLAVSRAQARVQLFVNEDDGGPSDVLAQAVTGGLLTKVRGSLT